MYDSKTVRRRRAVLAVLVALSLALLTAWFGESAGGGLHAVQRAVMQVLAPVQEGASRALKPARDFVGWFGDTLEAKEERDRLKGERDRLRREVTGLERAAQENAELRRLVQLDEAAGLDAYAPVTARVIVRSPSVWYATITIDKGSDASIAVNDPVVNGEGLVGEVAEVTSDAAQVRLITDHESAVSAEAVSSNEPGVILPAVGQPGDLILDLVTRSEKIRRGERVVTSGTTSSRLDSLFPPGILIGTVRRIDESGGELERKIHVTPAADLRRLDFVQVLTKRPSGARAATTP